MFKLLKKSKKSQARLGFLKTNRGPVRSPFFMPIATKGAVKNLVPGEIESQIILSNTYHLFLKPGIKTLKKAGGLHRFMNWPKPILTDSGGYQVFSLAKIRKINGRGVEFSSPEGKVFLTPEKSLEIQKALDSDIQMVLDVCPPFKSSRKEVEKAVERTTSWAQKSKKHFQKIKGKSLLFGIIQGGIYKDLREKSLKEISALDFDGYALGGLAVGEPEKEMLKILRFLSRKMPEKKPRYLMGAGYPEQIIRGVELGIDMFDCTIPTRHARHGEIFVFKKKSIKGEFYGRIKIRSKEYKNDFRPLDKNCSCFSCWNFSRSYLHHLYRSREPLYGRLATIHNLKFYLNLMERIRNGIKKGKI